MDVGAGQNLNAVIKLLPGEVYENPAWKGLAYLARDLVVYAAVVWALATFAHPLLLLPLWLLGGRATSGLFIIVCGGCGMTSSYIHAIAEAV